MIIKKLVGKKKEIQTSDVLKCPHCGEILDELDTICPACGNEVRRDGNDVSVKTLAQNIEKYEARNSIYNKVTSALTSRGKMKLSLVDKKEADYIESFPISNNKETMLEFFLYIKKRVEGLHSRKDSKIAWINVWKRKTNEIKTKADIMFPGDINIMNAYDSTIKTIKRIRRKDIAIYTATIVGLLVLLAGIIVFAVLASLGKL